MSIDYVKVVDGRVAALTQRVDDLERSVARLNARTADLLALWSQALDGRPVPRDFGQFKHEGLKRAGTWTLRLLDAPESPEPTDREQLTLENAP